MVGIPPEIVDEIMSYLQPGPLELLQVRASEEYTESTRAIGQCTSVCRVWYELSRRYRFKDWVITLRDPTYSPDAKTVADLLAFIRRSQFPRLTVRSLIMRNDSQQVMAAFQTAGMEGACSVDFSASITEIVGIVQALPALTTLKLSYFNILELARLPISDIQSAFDHITHFTFAGRAEISTGRFMPYAELCTLLSYFRSLEELVLDDVDILNANKSDGADLPQLPNLQKLVIHRCDNIFHLVNDITDQVDDGRLALLHHLELGMINASNQAVAHYLVSALASQLTSLALGHDYTYSLLEYINTGISSLDFPSCPKLVELRLIMDLSDPEAPHPPHAFEHLARMLVSVTGPADTVQELIIEYGEAPAVVASVDEPNFEVLSDVTCQTQIEVLLPWRFKALRAVRFVPLREYSFAVFAEDDQVVVRESFRGLDFRGLLVF
ncbi:uncharacterized protein PHACADRAFT_201534 [Phanerochaete carnosa HHB-10118-sp]|uniref:F-box domain-containing protein n=1 Tax=Phanerochaete carnosa (strain HHB-10118-sp) TaxID=650164 RepID=K5UJV8_PHACS|nr:uncharacterized protein PHACADRAFT_201534 [Phanerochaete carnosa HHB-10118-sp]EKM49831.1 hypothetical protein PHACADRAFT_201534 [Phanerochaete carnosa HHB-10118-sp]